MNEKWLNNKIKDEPVIGSNTRGTISFATNGPDSRTSVVDEKKYNHKSDYHYYKVFINYSNNSRLDAQGFAPFGKVTRGLEVGSTRFESK